MAHLLRKTLPSLMPTLVTVPPTQQERTSGTLETTSPLPRNGYRFPRPPMFPRPRPPPTQLLPQLLSARPPGPMTSLRLLQPHPPRPTPTTAFNPCNATVAEVTASHSVAAVVGTTVEAVAGLGFAAVDVEVGADHGAMRPRSSDLWPSALRHARRPNSHRRHLHPTAGGDTTDDDADRAQTRGTNFFTYHSNHQAHCLCALIARITRPLWCGMLRWILGQCRRLSDSAGKMKQDGLMPGCVRMAGECQPLVVL